MDRRRERRRIERSGTLLCSMLAVTLLAWTLGFGWFAVPGALGVLGLAAITVGADSRAPGDWRRVEQR